ncbi:porin [Caballeronia sp. dw_19]|uniref:porin n=1 Tax=Caballeronia sp. dw_19 TaxID=2719791 RepID=UPI001BD65F20|nr:porin [Caballeronia sp. dw_19]
MKKVALSYAALFAYAASAHAQSSVTLYGVLDDGISYVSNEGGHSAFLLADTISQGNRVGLKGVEDLGGGLKTLFTLEMFPNLNTGALRGPTGTEFSRGAYVGLAQDDYGQVTIGRQYDFMTYALVQYTGGLYSGILDVHPGDIDRGSGQWLNNSVQFQSVTFSGAKFGAMYSFGENSTTTTNYGRAFSLLGTYAHGPFSASAAMTDINGLTFSPYTGLGLISIFGQDFSATSATSIVLKNLRTVGFGTSYQFGRLKLAGVYSNTRLDSGASGSETSQSFEGDAAFFFTPSLILSGGYSYSKLQSSKWNKFDAVLDYLLSKRTDVYFSGHYLKASGPGTVAVYTTMTPSSDNKQAVVRIGMRHRF